MKKLLVLSAVSLSLFSCEQKLPSNIESEVVSVEQRLLINQPLDSLIVSLNKSDIDKMNEDSLTTLTIEQKMDSELYQSAKDRLNELLKYNPEYSDHTRIKNIKQPYFHSNMRLYYKNLSYIHNRRTLLQDKKYNLNFYKGVDYENELMIR